MATTSVTPYTRKNEDLFRMSGKQLRDLRDAKGPGSTAARNELARRKANGIATGKRPAPKPKAKKSGKGKSSK